MNFTTPATVLKNSTLICLSVQGMGHVPSKKNQRMAVHNSNGKGLRVISNPSSKEWMERCTGSFESQLFCACQTIAEGTSTEGRLRSLIASLPHDDAWQYIPELVIRAEKCSKGNEGATMIVERIATNE